MCEQTFDRKVTTAAEREPRNAFRVKADSAMTDHQKAQKAFHENRERLKEERLAREAKLKVKSLAVRQKRVLPAGSAPGVICVNKAKQEQLARP
jgi:hypothetical protein